MAAKTVKGTDGRVWAVSRHMMWRMPTSADDLEFEHDVEGGRIGQWVVVLLISLFFLVLMVWQFSGEIGPVRIPWFVKLFFLLVIVFFPIRWVLRRPWKLVAETQGGFDPVSSKKLPPEAWEGTVRGFAKARDETGLLVNTIRKRGRLSKADGLMRQLTVAGRPADA